METQSTDSSSCSAVSQTLKHRSSAPQIYENPEIGISQPLPPNEDDDDADDEDDKPESPLAPNNVKVKNKNRDFSFGKSRTIHYVAEKPMRLNWY